MVVCLDCCQFSVIMFFFSLSMSCFSVGKLFYFDTTASVLCRSKGVISASNNVNLAFMT